MQNDPTQAQIMPNTKTAVGVPGWALPMLILPIAFFFVLRATPWDARLLIPREHFEIVSLTAFLALVASLFTGLMLGQMRQRRATLLAMGLASLSGLFFLHGITTPGFLVGGNPVIGQMGVYSIFTFGVFAVLALREPDSTRAFSSHQFRWVWIGWTAVMLAIWFTGLFWQLPYQWVAALQPFWSYLLAGTAFFLYLAAAYRALHLHRNGQWSVASALLAAMLLMVAVPISQTLGETWRLSWWLYHVYMLLAFLLIMRGLVRSYEQLRTFSLTGYFAAISAIVTVFSFFIARELVVTFVAPQVDPAVYAQYIGPVLVVIGLMLFLLFGCLLLIVSHGDRLLRERERQLILAHDQLQSLLNAQPDGVIVLDRNGNIRRANPVAQFWLDGKHPHVEAQHLDALLARVVADPETEVESDLGLVVFQVRAATFGEGETVVMIHDISKLKELDRLKTRFVSDVSHELRTPVANIKLYLTLLREGRADRREKYLKTLEDQSDLLADLIEDVLNMARLDAIRPQELDTQPVQLNDLVGQIAEGYEPLAAARSITIEPIQADGLSLVAGDPSQLYQVLVNLLANAINYTHTGDCIYLRTLQLGPEMICLRVEDHGPGIAPEDGEHIFERFYRGNSDRKAQVNGTGLGLAIVKEIIERHGGTIEVETTVGVGTTFALFLPAIAEK